LTIALGWISDDASHEGYLVPHFLDGQRAAAVTGGSIPEDQIAVGEGEIDHDGALAYRTRPAAEVVGWVVCCNCAAGRAMTTWTGPTFTRVPSPSLESIRARRVFAADDKVPYVGERPEVEDAARELWRLEHVFGTDAVGEVQAAAAAAAQSDLRLETAVALARHSGASWETIGRASGMSAGPPDPTRHAPGRSADRRSATRKMG
jgi:hypothetical protein